MQLIECYLLTLDSSRVVLALVRVSAERVCEICVRCGCVSAARTSHAHILTYSHRSIKCEQISGFVCETAWELSVDPEQAVAISLYTSSVFRVILGFDFEDLCVAFNIIRSEKKEI